MVNVQINGATISWTCLSSLYFVLSLGSPTSIHPHIRNILDSLFYISISSGEKIALRNYQTGLLFSIEGELPNWPISPCSPSSSTLKLGPVSYPISRGLSWAVKQLSDWQLLEMRLPGLYPKRSPPPFCQGPSSLR